MELIVEVIVELFVQIAFEVVIEFGGRAVGRVLATRIGRIVATATVMAAIGLGGGYAWGRHVADIGHGTPRTIWVSLGLAVLAATLALRVRSDAGLAARFALLPAIVRPTPERLALLSFLNVMIASGVALGFNA